jgi:hypothetical protein
MLRNPRVHGWLSKISRKLKLNKIVFHANARDMQRIYCRAK